MLSFILYGFRQSACWLMRKRVEKMIAFEHRLLPRLDKRMID